MTHCALANCCCTTMKSKNSDGKLNERGYSLIPLSLYFREGKVKMLLALAKGKRKYDKRESIRQRDKNGTWTG